MRFPHFEVEAGKDGLPIELGAGAMAVTFRARDTVLDCTVALKVIDRKVATNPIARTRFLREARAAARLYHPNVARVTYYGEQDGECFYAMEFVEGETLEERVRREGPLLPALALEVTLQAARALTAAESCGVVHRDFKPSNLMIASRQGEEPTRRPHHQHQLPRRQPFPAQWNPLFRDEGSRGKSDSGIGCGTRSAQDPCQRDRAGRAYSA